MKHHHQKALTVATATALALISHVAHAEVLPTCPAASTSVVVTPAANVADAAVQLRDTIDAASKVTSAGGTTVTETGNAITKSLILRLSGKFAFETALQINRSCITLTSANPAAPATLTINKAKYAKPVGASAWFLRTPAPTTLPLHHITISYLSMSGGGIELNGSDHLISGNAMTDVRYNTYEGLITIGNGLEAADISKRITVTGNRLSNAAGGIGGPRYMDSHITLNTFTNVDQGMGASHLSINNEFSGNRGTGFKRMAVELLWNDAQLPDHTSFATRANRITNNVFGPWSKSPVDTPLAISFQGGYDNTIEGNTLNCGDACLPTLKKGEAPIGQRVGAGIEGHGVRTMIRNNSVSGFGLGIWGGQTQKNEPDGTLTTIDNNRVSNVNLGISFQCAGPDPTPANFSFDRAGCHRALVISNNTISEARDAGISGDGQYFGTDPSGNPAHIYFNALRELVSLKITHNTITRTYGAFPGELRPWGYAAMMLTPLFSQNPTKLIVSDNTITLKGTPDSYASFNGVVLRLVADDTNQKVYDTNNFNGAQFSGNTISSRDTAFSSGFIVFEPATDSTAGATFTNNTLTNLKAAFNGVSPAAVFSGNICSSGLPCR
jgi:hypothetical protein